MSGIVTFRSRVARPDGRVWGKETLVSETQISLAEDPEWVVKRVLRDHLTSYPFWVSQLVLYVEVGEESKAFALEGLSFDRYVKDILIEVERQVSLVTE